MATGIAGARWRICAPSHKALKLGSQTSSIPILPYLCPLEEPHSAAACGQKKTSDSETLQGAFPAKQTVSNTRGKTSIQMLSSKGKVAQQPGCFPGCTSKLCVPSSFVRSRHMPVLLLEMEFSICNIKGSCYAFHLLSRHMSVLVLEMEFSLCNIKGSCYVFHLLSSRHMSAVG